MKRVFPGPNWERAHPGDAGMSAERLAEAERWLTDVAGERPFHAVIIRNGFLVAEWNHGAAGCDFVDLTSASKSAYACLVGIAVHEGKIKSLDDRVVEYFPDMMHVKDGEGPKNGRYAFKENEGISFRHLLGNTSGYMKPGEQPGKRFHYQTFGMNVLTNALGTIYGLYDSRNPMRLPGCAKLLENRIRDLIGGTWRHSYRDFVYATGSSAKSSIFGHGLHVVATALDAARLGYLWMNRGDWDGRRVVPADFLQEATKTNQDILNNEPERNWKYGLGFWVNDHGKLWPDLPRDLFGAWGGGAKNIWVCPGEGVVIVLVPGPWAEIRAEPERLPREQAVLQRVFDAILT